MAFETIPAGSGQDPHAGAKLNYEPPETFLGEPGARKLRAIILGAGISGIMMAYKIQRDCHNVEIVVYDKNADIGGTWFENRYPGAGCDIPAHAYSYPFALYPEWPRHNAYREDIQGYLCKVVEVFRLRKYMRFNSTALRADWQDAKGVWKVQLQRIGQAGQLETFEEEGELLIWATGLLNERKWPAVKGFERFQGRLMHSSNWDVAYGKTEWKNDRVAVIGSGASGIQIVAAMQSSVNELHNYVRSGKFFSAIADNFGIYRDYPEGERKRFRTNSQVLVDHVKNIETQMEIAVDMQIKGTETAKGAKEFFTRRMKELLADERLLKGFLPDYDLGCKRVQPGDAYMKAIQEKNVKVRFAAATEFKEHSIVDSEGIEVEVDTIICATGFDTTRRARIPIKGKNGIDLREMWAEDPYTYLGVTIPNMPNLFLFMGPTYPVHNGSIMGPLNANGDYVTQCITKMQSDGLKDFSPRVDRTAAFNAHAQKWIQRTVWTQPCSSWFKNNETGKVTALWPGSALHFVEAIKTPRWEDYELTYISENPLAWLGAGFTWAEKTKEKDPTPFLSSEKLDPEWRKSVFNEG